MRVNLRIWVWWYKCSQVGFFNYLFVFWVTANSNAKSGANRGQIGIAKSVAEADQSKNVAPIQLTRHRVSWLVRITRDCELANSAAKTHRVSWLGILRVRHDTDMTGVCRLFSVRRSSAGRPGPGVSGTKMLVQDDNLPGLILNIVLG